MDWLTAGEALDLLGTQPQTLYANVSRGRIKARPDPADSRRSLYRGEDVRRLAQRARGRRTQEVVASQAMQWGEPILPTSLSTIRDGRLLYRGEDAALLADTATLEEAACLLWQFPFVDHQVDGVKLGLEGAFLGLAQRAATSVGASRFGVGLQADANGVLAVLATAIAGQGNGHLHQRLAYRWGRPDAAEAIRHALVLLADHELNASTFAARVTVSTGASLWSGALAGMATLRGPRHGLASPAVAALADDVGALPERAEAALREWLGEGRHIPGIGHRLYPAGDPRCRALLRAFDMPPEFSAFLDASKSLTAEEPNIDFALAAMAVRFELPADAGISLFALARSVGWVAHMMEQLRSGQQIRPRARYVGPG